MQTRERPAAIIAAFRHACAVEIVALKPGNVHIHAPGHGMTAVDFLRSAKAAAGPLCRPGARLGARVLDAVAATRAVVGQNTNLGILLLCAPLAMAAEAGGPLRTVLADVLNSADIADAQAVFRAIVLASPGGLGEVPEHDVRKPATVPLRVAMAAAAGRDSISRQYVTGFSDLFQSGVPAYAEALARGWPTPWAAVAVYLGFLAGLPDSHVRRKHGAAAAEALRVEARSWRQRLVSAGDPAALTGDLTAWDAALKRRGVNPGTSADLTVASIFAHALSSGLQSARLDG
jgi:triphosphoribosyl-dephospho-CoA synthase